MGIYTDFLTLGTQFPDAAPRVGLDRAAAASLERQIDNYDPEIGSPYSETNEVQVLGQLGGTPSGGTYTVTFILADGTTFTTATIAYNANAATIEGAIDTAATGTVTGWTNGDISVSGGGLDAADVTLTFDGDSVSGANHSQTTVDSSGVTGGATAGTDSTSTEGQPKRLALAILFGMNIVAGSIPEHGEPVTDWVKGDPIVPQPSFSLVDALADQAGYEGEDISVINSLKSLYGPGIR